MNTIRFEILVVVRLKLSKNGILTIVIIIFKEGTNYTKRRNEIQNS